MDAEAKAIFMAWFVGWPAAWSLVLWNLEGWRLVAGFVPVVVGGAVMLELIHRRWGVVLGSAHREG